MKNNKFKKISLVILTLALCLGAVFAMSISADEPSAQNTENGPVIISQNIQYKEMFRLMYAVDPATVVDPTAEITLNVYDVDPEINTSTAPLATMKATATSDAEQLGVLKDRGYDSAYIFLTTKGVSYNNMLQNFYAQVVDSDGTAGPVKRYSVAEYFYQMLASNPTDEVAKATYENAIAFGASVQQLLAKDSETTSTLVSDVRYVVIADNDPTVLDGKYKAGVYEEGTQLPLSVSGAVGAKYSYAFLGAAGNQLKSESGKAQVLAPTAADDETAGEVIAKVEISSGNIISYHKNYNNLNSYDDYAAMYDALCNGSNGTKASEIIDVGGSHGKVLDLNFAKSDDLRFDMIETDVAAESAGAFEVSFDVKLELLENATDTDHATFDIQFRGDKLYARVAVYLMSNGNTSVIGVAKGGDGFSAAETYTVDTTEWVHVKMVIYDGNNVDTDSNVIYVYINGDEDNYLTVENYSANLTTLETPGDISNITGMRFGSVSDKNNNFVTSDVYVDNFFFGFTDETKPQPSTTE